jgi:very-short-patch-repair endonuclease
VLIEAILRAQSGVIGRPQALAAGLSEDQIDGRLAAGKWRAVHPRVYRLADREPTDEARVRAAGLWAGEGATVTGLAAAWWHGLWPDPPSTVEITVPVTRGLRGRPGIKVRRRDLSDLDRVAIRGQWVTALPLTVLEATVALGERGSRLIDNALQRRVRFDTLRRAYCRNLGGHGSAAAKRLLAAASDRAASGAERTAISLLRAANLTGWRTHYRANSYELDLAFPDHHLAVEIDGWAWHHDASSFQADRTRQNDLVLAGWTVLRFTWHDLNERPAQYIAEIRTALAARSPLPYRDPSISRVQARKR